MGCLKCLSVGAAIVAVLVYYFAFYEPVLKPLENKDEWWGLEPKPQVSKAEGIPQKFELKYKQSDEADLKSRLKSTRLAEPLTDVAFEYGFNTKYLKKVIDHWVHKYDWKKEVARINSFPQYLMEVDGLKIHYVHVKPNTPKKKVVPLMIIHGWPGSVMEFYKAIPMLTKPSESHDFVFEVICPSIPGYGFSEAAHRKGFNQMEAAKVFHKLMKNLGHEKYYVQGGDWGSIIANFMAVLQPDSIYGIHLNMLPMSEKNQMWKLGRWILGSMVPQLAPKNEFEIEGMYPISGIFKQLLQISGYAHLQATKPDTVGVGLSNSPAGLAAYILEKFGGWTKPEKSLISQDGAIEDDFSLDELLTNVMVYWIKNSVTSSFRFYKESFTAKLFDTQIAQRDILPLCSFLVCENEMNFMTPIVGHTCKNLIHYDKEKCGHFAAMQKPSEFSNSLWKFAAKAEIVLKKKKAH